MNMLRIIQAKPLISSTGGFSFTVTLA